MLDNSLNGMIPLLLVPGSTNIHTAGLNFLGAHAEDVPKVSNFCVPDLPLQLLRIVHIRFHHEAESAQAIRDLLGIPGKDVAVSTPNHPQPNSQSHTR